MLDFLVYHILQEQDLEKPIMLCLLGTGMIQKLGGGETELQHIGRRIIPETHLFLHSIPLAPHTGKDEQTTTG